MSRPKNRPREARKFSCFCHAPSKHHGPLATECRQGSRPGHSLKTKGSASNDPCIDVSWIVFLTWRCTDREVHVLTRRFAKPSHPPSPSFASDWSGEKLELKAAAGMLSYVSRIFDTTGAGRRSFVRTKPFSFNSCKALLLRTPSIAELPIRLLSRVAELFVGDTELQD